MPSKYNSLNKSPIGRAKLLLSRGGSNKPRDRTDFSLPSDPNPGVRNPVHRVDSSVLRVFAASCEKISFDAYEDAKARRSMDM